MDSKTRREDYGVDPQITAALTDPDAYVLISRMLWMPVVSGGMAGIPAVVSAMAVDNKAAVATTTSGSLIDQAVKALSGATQQMRPAYGVDAILWAFRAIASAQFDAQYDAVMQSSNLTTGILSYAKATAVKMLVEVEQAVPFSLKDAPDLVKDEQRCRQVAGKFLDTIPKELRAALFPAPIVDLFFACIRPFLRVKLLAAFGNVATSSVTEMHYCKTALYLIVEALFARIVEPDAAAQASASAAMAAAASPTIGDVRTTLVSARNGFRAKVEAIIESSRASLQDVYEVTSKLHKRAVQDAGKLQRTNDDLEFRRTTLQSLTATSGADEKSLRRARAAFNAWVAAFCVAAGVCTLLLVMGKYNAMMLVAVSVVLVVSVAALARTVMGMTRWSRGSS